VRLVDLDFDVIVWRDRSVELVDEDEFEQHRVELGYPDELVAAARAESARVFEQVAAGVPPFSLSTAAPWMQTLDQALT
jgi:protein associated with RNAse G/E